MTTAHRSIRGQTADAAGRAAEEQVARTYANNGAQILATRWRGAAGEIDIILRDKGVIVFVEVKSSKRMENAAAALSPRQQQRIMTAAEEYCAALETGSLTDMRFDVALLNGTGEIQIVEGALGV